MKRETVVAVLVFVGCVAFLGWLRRLDDSHVVQAATAQRFIVQDWSELKETRGRIIVVKDTASDRCYAVAQQEFNGYVGGYATTLLGVVPCYRSEKEQLWP